MHAIAEAAFKAVAVEQRQKELKVFFLTVVWGGSHQQKMARDGREQLAQFVAFGVFDLAAKEGCR